MSERSAWVQALVSILIAIGVLFVVGLAIWVVQRVDGVMGHGPLPSGVDGRRGYVLTLIAGASSLTAGGLTVVGVRQAKYFALQFAWLTYLLVGGLLLAVMLVPLQRYGSDSFLGLPGFLVSPLGRGVIGASLGALLIGAVDTRRLVPNLILRSAKPVAKVSPSLVRGLPGRFTPSAWRALSFMQEEAQRFEHAYMGTEHLLLGILRDPRSHAVRVIVNLNGDPGSIRSQVEGVFGRRGSLYTGASGMTRRCQKEVESAARMARGSGERLVSTGHLLQGLAEDHDDMAGQVLEDIGLSPERIAAELKHLGPESQ